MNHHLASLRAIHSLLFACTFTFLASVLAAQSSPDAPLPFDIPSGDASTMLKQFADQSNKEILFDVRNVSGIKTRAVRGTLTPEQALEQMLADTGLVSGNDLRTGAIAVRRETDDINDVRRGTRIEDGMVKLERYEIVERRMKPFTDDNTDIPRTIDDAKPYFIFNAETIERAGATNVEDFLNRRLTMTSNFGSFSSLAPAVSGPYNLTTGAVSMRGLPHDATLILLNGRRLPNTIGGVLLNSPDLNAIPMGMIERIEVLPSSASGIYGGSAVGGVINIITKRRYRGGEIKLTYDNSFDSDSAKRRADITYGFGLEGGRTQVVLFASYSDGNFMAVADRQDLIRKGIARAQANDPAFFGQGTLLVGMTPRVSSTNGSPLVLKDEFGGQTLGSNFVFLPPGYRGPRLDGGAVLVPRAGQLLDQEWPNTPDHPNGLQNLLFNVGETKSFRAEVRREMTSRIEAFVDYMYELNYAEADQPVLTSQLQQIPASAPDNPFNQDVDIRASFRQTMATSTEHDRHRVVGGFTAKLPHDWVVQADYAWNKGSNDTIFANVLSAGPRADATSGARNFFVDTLNSDIDVSDYFVGGSDIQAPNIFTHELGARGSGPLPTLFGVQPNLALALQQRKEGRDFVFIGGSFGDTYGPPQHQVVRNVYAELTVPFFTRDNAKPFLRLLELQLTQRVDDYDVNIVKSTTGAGGNSFNPNNPPPLETVSREYRSSNSTIGLRWKPHDDFMLRASYATGFKPPSFFDLIPGNPRSFQTTITDPRRGNEPYRVRESGLLGNPNLLPEETENWTAGIVLTPGALPGLRVALDYVRIDKSNDIAQLSQQALINDEALFAHRITREPAAPGDPFGVGRVTDVDWSRLNLFRTQLEAYDLTVNYRHATETWGSFEYSAMASYQTTYNRQIALSSPTREYVGTPGMGGPLRLRANASLTWERGPWLAGWTTTYYDDYKQIAAPFTTSNQFILINGGPTVEEQFYHDLFVQHRFADRGRKWSKWLFANTQLLVGIRNVFDTAPAFDGSQSSRFFFSPFGDLRMRSYYISLKRGF